MVSLDPSILAKDLALVENNVDPATKPKELVLMNFLLEFSIIKFLNYLGIDIY
jgi:hypothetical protein